jgi:hypothetical protein
MTYFTAPEIDRHCQVAINGQLGDLCPYLEFKFDFVPRCCGFPIECSISASPDLQNVLSKM